MEGLGVSESSQTQMISQNALSLKHPRRALNGNKRELIY